MKNTYKLPWHVRQYVKAELMEYKGNKKLLAKCQGNTRTLLLIQNRLEKIEAVFEALNEEDRDVAEIIFYYKYTQAGAETAKSVSKAMYYNTMNKVIYLVAKEMDLI